MKRVSLLFSIAIPVFALIALFKIFALPVHAVEVWGFISSDTIWTLENSPYIVDEIYIDSGVTLTIEAGVEVYAKYPVSSMNIGGHLVVGSEVGPTTIISGLNTINFGPLIYDPDGADGSGVINNTLIIGDGVSSYGIEIVGNSNNLVSIKNSVIQSEAYPIRTYPNSLHRLQMENVSFVNNVNNQVFISYDSDDYSLSDSTVLKPQPGLESYEFDTNGRFFSVPLGITLTLEAGTVITGASGLGFGGHLIAEGTLTNPVKIIGGYPLIFYSSGSGDIQHTIISGITHGLNRTRLGVEIRGDSNNLVSIKYSEIENVEFPIQVSTDAVQRLQIDNITSTNNVNNRILLEGVGDGFIKDTTLTPHPGFESYQLGEDDYGQLYWMRIPSGITLTLEAGVTLSTKAFLQFEGNLVTHGTTISPTAITETKAIDILASASVDINHTIISGDNDVDGRTRIVLFGDSNNLFSIKNSVIQNFELPIIASANSIHRLHMVDVSFISNEHNRVFFSSGNGLSTDVVLTPQTGLEGYEIRDSLGLIGGTDPSEIIVPHGITLTLQDGVTLFNEVEQRIVVNGRFIANGTQLNPVNITSANDSAPGEWGGISVNGGEVILNHTNLRNGEVNLALTSPDSSVTISNSTVISASQSGISVTGGLLNMECSVLAENGLAGLWIGSGGTPDVTINRTDIWGNGAGITNTNSTFINARYNWWGASDGPSGDFSGSGDPAFGNILHSPWLSTPNDCGEPPFRVFLPMILAPDD